LGKKLIVDEKATNIKENASTSKHEQGKGDGNAWSPKYSMKDLLILVF
jgi:hypothetical protein